jgi:hypothetical protein
MFIANDHPRLADFPTQSVEGKTSMAAIFKSPRRLRNQKRSRTFSIYLQKTFVYQKGMEAGVETYALRLNPDGSTVAIPTGMREYATLGFGFAVQALKCEYGHFVDSIGFWA